MSERDQSESARRAIGAALAALLLAAMDSTAVGTILPTMVGDLGHGSAFVWLVSGFILTQTIASPIFGRVADSFGLKPAFTVALVVFCAGSAWVAGAPSLGWAIAARMLQGFGAGGIPTLCYTVVARLSTPAERPKRQALVSSIYGVAAILGPVASAIAAATIGWRWVFLVNLPAGAVILVIVARAFPRHAVAGAAPRTGWSQLALFSGALTLLLLTIGGRASGLSSTALAACGAGFVVASSALFIVRRLQRAASPGVSATHGTTQRIAILASVCAAIVLYGTITFVPQLLQTGMGLPVSVAGAGVLAGALGWVAGAIVTGKLLVRRGYRDVAVAGALAMTIGCVGIAASSLLSSGALVAVSQLLVGVGMGAVSTAALLAAQNASSAANLGTTTAAIQLARSVGAAVGINVLAAIEQGALAARGFSATLEATGHDAALATSAPRAALSAAFATGFASLVPLTLFLAAIAARLPARFGDAQRATAEPSSPQMGEASPAE